eukprot:3645412-Amphidinium_carterae.1
MEHLQSEEENDDNNHKDGKNHKVEKKHIDGKKHQDHCTSAPTQKHHVQSQKTNRCSSCTPPKVAIRTMIHAGDMSPRYWFASPLQAAIYRMVHGLFSLGPPETPQKIHNQ